MLIHITPSIYLGSIVQPQVCYLEALKIRELGLLLFRKNDLVTRRPYPNKQFLVACRKKGRKAMNGILIDSSNTLESFTVQTLWITSGEERNDLELHHHQCTYIVLDRDFDAVTNDMTLWNGSTGHELGEWPSRWPKKYAGMTPMRVEPRMDVWDAKRGGIERQGDVKDVVRRGNVIKRTETFLIPTIEPERLLSHRGWSERIPGIDLAFKLGDEHGRKLS